MWTAQPEEMPFAGLMKRRSVRNVSGGHTSERMESADKCQINAKHSTKRQGSALPVIKAISSLQGNAMSSSDYQPKLLTIVKIIIISISV